MMYFTKIIAQQHFVYFIFQRHQVFNNQKWNVIPKSGYKFMSPITNTILSPSIPNPQYKKYLNGRLTLTNYT